MSLSSVSSAKKSKAGRFCFARTVRLAQKLNPNPVFFSWTMEPEERLAGLDSLERLAGLDLEEIEQYLQQLRQEKDVDKQ